jgi:transposase
VTTSPPPTETPKGQRRGQVLEVLKALLAEGRLDEVLALVSKLVARNSELERRLAEVVSRGKKNEGVSSEQLLLLLDGLSGAPSAHVAEADEHLRAASGIDQPPAEQALTNPPKRPPAVRRPLPTHLRRVENVIPVPDGERPCPRCGALRTCIGHDVSQVIDLIPAEVVVRVDRREKLACPTCESEVVRAPLGDKPVVGGSVGTTLVSQVLVDKYWDGLPLHRQKQRFARLGAALPVSTLAEQVTWSTDLLRPLWRVAQQEVLRAPVMHLDGTSLPVLDKATAKGIKLGSLWGYIGVEGEVQTALYLYASTGKKVGQLEGELGPEDVLKQRTGYTVADASSIFDASFQRDELIECGCNMHARRYFTKALDAGDTRAALPLAAFKKLYQVEDELRGQDSEARLLSRQSRSKPVYDELITWCLVHQPYEPPSSAMGRALNYLLNHREALQRFLGDGIIPIDNGAVERLHVRAALTRKNFLFAGSDAGGERAAIAFTVLGCCQLAGVNPVEYLAEVLPRLAKRIRLIDIPALMPARWKASRAASPPGADVRPSF